MLKDLRIGLTIWKSITNLKYVVIQVALTVVTGCMAAVFAAPRIYERVNEISLTMNMDGNRAIIALVLFYIVAFNIVMKRIVYRTYDKNKYLFYQLAVGKRAGYICTMLQQLKWYGCAMVMLLAICDHVVVPVWFLISLHTVLFIIGFHIDYHMADLRIDQGKRMHFTDLSGRNKSKEKNIFDSHPILEIFNITIHGLYRCKSLTMGKIILLILIVYCGMVHILRGSIFFLADAFLILLNDGYWRNESRNFRYFSEIGIPVSKYLSVHLLAGICYNIAIPLLLFCSMTGEMAATAVGFLLLSYLLIFWYMTQIYLYLHIGRDKEGIIMLCGLFFLMTAVIPPVGFLVMVWLYKRIVYQWRKKNALCKWSYEIL